MIVGKVEVVEDGAVLNHTRLGVAVCNRILESGDIPSVEEIPMVTVTGWVTEAPDKGLLITIPHVGKGIGVPVNFKEE